MSAARRPWPIAIMISLAGCVSDGPQPPPRQQPRQIEAATDLPVDRVMLSVESFSEDTDENGYYDSFGLTVYLFPDPSQNPLPMHVPGTLVFELKDPARNSLAVWEIPPDKLNRLRGAAPTGLLGYLTTLNINDVASDELRVNKGLLNCRFVPLEGGDGVVSRGSATVRIGPTGVSRGG